MKIPAPGEKFTLTGLNHDEFAPLVIEQLPADQPLLVITPTSAQAQALAEQSEFLNPQNPLRLFPDWETLAYDHFSPHEDIISERLKALDGLSKGIGQRLVVPAGSLLQRMAPQSFIANQCFSFTRGQKLAQDTFTQHLAQMGYQRVSQVYARGEFAVRGSVVDTFPMGAPAPLRLDFFDDELDSLYTFDLETQKNQQALQRLDIFPAHEFPLDEEGIQTFRKAFRKTFDQLDATQSPVYQAVSDGHTLGGLEYYLPLFFTTTASLLDFFPKNTLVVFLGDNTSALVQAWNEINDRYQRLRFDLYRPPLPPKELSFNPDEILQKLAPMAQLRLEAQSQAKHQQGLRLLSLPPLQQNLHQANPFADLEHWAKKEGVQTLILTTHSLGRRENLHELLKRHGYPLQVVENWAQITPQHHQAWYLLVAPFDLGWHNPQQNLALVPESVLFGFRAKSRQAQQAKKHSDFETAIASLAELKPQDPVVHEHHGIGRYLGLEILEAGGMRQEFLALEYAKETKLYVPVTDMHLISRYTASHPENVNLHALGSDKWVKTKEKAAQKIKDVAAELLDIYARRGAAATEALSQPGEDALKFAMEFPFDETPDQLDAIHAISQDLQGDKPMDRLICGDVGFGKTEVAMRAAFLAVQSGKQVVVLVPTTLLASQHYQTFADRFANWPVRLALFSRFSSGHNTSDNLKALAEGKVDIAIGTHKLIQKDIQFKNLGLVIIDEEHRFGVKQKEQLKSLRANVHMLTMTATPIPRTLNLSMQGVRDLSIIATPPRKRLSVQTFVQAYNNELIKEACQRELHRGGQVFVLQNDIGRMPNTVDMLEQLLPKTKVVWAHGQMPEKQLEQVMLDFVRQRAQILVSTTIIENGIDIPNANTIIILEANQFGLAQLHQLRGRVGRSHHQAYAYLLTGSKVTSDAKKRLEAIAAHTELGAGFMLATQDMEIRGTGQILGDEQSGQIEGIGLSLYLEMLERTVKALKSGKTPEISLDQANVDIELGIPALLPEDFMPDVRQRLIYYKRIATALDLDNLKDLQAEVVDRYGVLPEATQNLFQITQLKIQFQQLGVSQIKANAKGIKLTFSKTTPLDPVKLIKLIQSQSKTYKMTGSQSFDIQGDFSQPQRRLTALDNLLKELSP